MNKFYEIRDTKTNELLVDGLTEEQVLKMFEVYQNYFGAGSVYLTHYIVPKKPIHIGGYEHTRAQEYKNDFILLFAELQAMGNLL